MTKHITKIMTLMLTLLTLAACGGGGGGGGASAKTTATVKVALNGTLPAGTALNGAVFTLTLPGDVTPELVNGVVASTVVTASGTFSGGVVTPVVYKEATATSAGVLVIAIASAADAGVSVTGEVATVTLHLANSTEPAVTSFTLDQSATDMSGKVVSGLSAAVSGVTLQ
jgi:hypothetical protein